MRQSIYLAAFLLLLFQDFASAAEIKYTGAGLRDPFAEKKKEKAVVVNVSMTEEKIRSMAVQGVLVSTDKPRAIISGKIYMIGSSLEDGKVVKIEKNGVTVAVNNKEILIPYLPKRLMPNVKA